MDGEEVAFGPGKAELLGLIRETGSIRKACARMGMSYNRAWTLVRDMNGHFKEPLVAAARGGDTGGGAALTETGLAVIECYGRMVASCHSATREDWQAIRRMLR